MTELVLPDAIVPLARLVIKKLLRDRLADGAVKFYRAVSLNTYLVSAYPR